MLKKILFVIVLSLLPILISFAQENQIIGKTEITKWQYGKRTAISITYDDNTINQFRVAMPIMDKLGFPGTFYVITGSVPNSKYRAKFIGRPVNQIIAETARIPTNKSNFFERVSAVRFLGYADTYNYHRLAGSQFEKGNIQKAYNLIDDVYRRVRKGEFKPSNDSIEARKALYDVRHSYQGVDVVTWDQLKKYQANGHEFGSHTISHPYMVGLDSVNLMYELQKSKAELRKHLGSQATFSAECPFGIENDRVLNYALDIYPALRNKMSEPYIYEINRGSNNNPTHSEKEYVQWHRGALSNTPMKIMKSWVDTALKKDNIWLVLVFHGVDGIGWEPLTKEELLEYFIYIKNKEENIWVSTFKDVTKYIRERENAKIEASKLESDITINLTHSLKDDRYTLPLTLKTYVPNQWGTVTIRQGNKKQKISTQTDDKGSYIIYQAYPNSETVNLTKS